MMHECPECGMPCDCDGVWMACDHCLEEAEEPDTDGWWVTFGGEDDETE